MLIRVCRAFTVNGPINKEVDEDLSAASYICELNRVPGRFLPEKAIELGVPRGEAFSILKNGNPYTLEDGTVILPDQVRSTSSFDGWGAGEGSPKRLIPPSLWNLKKVLLNVFLSALPLLGDSIVVTF